MQPRQQMIPLANFVQSHTENSVEAANNLVTTFLNGQVPQAQYFP